MNNNALVGRLEKNANARRGFQFIGGTAGAAAGRLLSPLTKQEDLGDDKSARNNSLNELAYIAAGAVLGVVAANSGMRIWKG